MAFVITPDDAVQAVLPDSKPPFVMSSVAVPPLALTVRFSVVVWLRLPDVPVIVTNFVPVAAVLLALNVSVLLPVVLAGLNDAVTPDGSPDADKATLPLKPFCGVTVIVSPTPEPCATVAEAGDAASEKSGVGEEPATAKIRSS